MPKREFSFERDSDVVGSIKKDWVKYKTMDIVIDIQGFRDAEERFIPKEVAVVAINTPIIGQWIIMRPCPFDELSVNSRRENNWLTRNYHGIEWFDGEVNLKHFKQHLREIIRQARYIYSRGHEKVHYLRNLLSKNVYNLEGISPAFKNLPDAEESGHRCTYHGFRAKANFQCALRNAYKIKRWLIEQNSRSSSRSSSLPFDKSDSEEEEGEVTYRTASAIDEDEEVIPLIRPLPSYEFTGNFTRPAPTERRIHGSLSSRQATEGVDEVDRHHR